MFVLQMSRFIGLRSGGIGPVDRGDQVCTSKIGQVTMDDALVRMVGIGRRGGLPCWYECKVRADDPGMRDLQFSRDGTSPRGLIAQNASMLVSLLEDSVELLLADKEDCEGGRVLRAALHTAMGLKRTASQAYQLDEELESAEYCRDDAGVRIATSMATSVALQEAARAGLGQLYTRPGLIYTADCGIPTSVVVDKFLASITSSDKAEVIDAVVQQGMQGGAMEVARLLGKVRLQVAVTPAAHDRIASVLPVVWEEWESHSHRELWMTVENTEDSSCSGNWQSMSGVNWQVTNRFGFSNNGSVSFQVFPAHPYVRNSMKPGFNASVELFCSGGSPECNGKLAVVTGQEIGKLAGTDEGCGLNRTLVWTSTPVKECPCASSVAVRRFATSLEDNRKILEVIRERDLHARLKEWKVHTEQLMARALASGSPVRLLESQQRATRALSFAEEAADQLAAAGESLDRFSDTVFEDTHTSDL